MAKSSRKGGANERTRAREWSLWWSGGERDDIFYRILGSGGRATQRTKAGKQTAAAYGDLMAEDPDGIPLISYCTIELKKGYSKDIDLLSLIDGRGGKYTFMKFWKKICSDAEEAGKAGWGKEPILILHRDYKLPVIILRGEFYSKLTDYCGQIAHNLLRLYIDEDILFVLKLSDFFANVTPAFFKKKETMPSHA